MGSKADAHGGSFVAASFEFREEKIGTVWPMPSWKGSFSVVAANEHFQQADDENAQLEHFGSGAAGILQHFYSAGPGKFLIYHRRPVGCFDVR